MEDQASIREQIEQLYWKDGLSRTQVAARLGVASSTLQYWMLQLGIRRRTWKEGQSLRVGYMGEKAKERWERMRSDGKLEDYRRACRDRQQARSIPLEDRFWSKVNRLPGDACWMWTGAHIPLGYGYILVRRGDIRSHEPAHRISWEMANGHIPDGMHVLHRCDVPACVRPDHLFLGTQRDNSMDMIAKGRQRFVVLRGEVSGTAKLSDAQVQALREERRLTNASYAHLANKFGISQAYVGEIVRGESRKGPGAKIEITSNGRVETPSPSAPTSGR